MFAVLGSTLQRSKDAVARIAQSRHDIGSVVQALVDGARVQTHLGIVLKHGLDTLGCRNEHQQAKSLTP